ncbi:MAG: chromosome segregation protein, partial [Epulopiscium sp.]|nr:chromosome segregation protein [Candidatus Epulonipiscium sp.]
MYLKRLEIQGFKSFADTLKLDFNKGISAVVGPNGSGKSNIADSIRWVLGEQSAKTLRGSKMEDIIFAGTQNRKPLGFAEVTITFDNSDGKIPISFGEVSITRRIYRSGESEYSINGTSCRLRDIYELFMDTGVGKEGYSIIGQGQIDRILSSKPEDRRFLFEEAVGIVKYKNRKLEAEKKLEIERQNLIRVEDIISELEKQIQPLSLQAEKAKEYLSIKEKLKIVDLNIFIEEADQLRKELTTLEESSSINEEELMRQKNFLSDQKEEYARIRQEIDKTEEEIFQIQNNISDIKTLIEKIEGDNKVILQEIHHLSQDIRRLQNECEQLQGKVVQKDEEKVQLSFKANGITLELKSKKAILEEKEHHFNELTKLLSASETEIERFKSDIIEKMNQSSDLKSNIQKMKGLLEQIENRRNQIETEKSRIKSQYKEQEVHLKALNKIHEDKQSKIQILQKDIDELKVQNKQILEAIQQKNRHTSALTEKMHQLKSRQQILEQMEKEFEGFSKSVKSILRLKQEHPESWKGICGVVAELVKVPEGYETAIEVALGSSMQNIVTTTEEVSKKAIEYLRKNQLGRSTFLPLSAIKEKELGKEKNQLMQEEGVLGIASSIISYEPIYHNVISYLLGRVIIVKD